MKQVSFESNTIAQEVRNFLLKYSTADDIDSEKLVSDVLMFPEYADKVKLDIEGHFKIVINQDIAHMTVTKLYDRVTGLYIKSGRRIPQASNSKTPGSGKQEAMWNRTGIYSYIVVRLRKLVETEHNIKIRDLLADLQSEHEKMYGNTVAFDQLLRDIEKKFGIVIDPTWTVGQLVNAAETSFIVQGKALDIRTPKDAQNSIWRAILYNLHLTPFLYYLADEFGVNIRRSTLLSTTSFSDLEDRIYQVKAIQQIREIITTVLRCTSNKIRHDFDFVKYFNVTDDQKAKIKRAIVEKYGIEITGDFNTVGDIANYFPKHSSSTDVITSGKYVAPTTTIWCKQK